MHYTASVILIVTTSLTLVVTSLDNNNITPVELKWGVADGSAVVGRLYQMHIPSDAFSGDILSYKIQSSSGDPLPHWIDFDSSRNVLYGLPTKKDVGQLELEVTAQGKNSQASVTFTVVVRDVHSLTSGSPLRFQSRSKGPEIIRCKREEPETVATIIIDADMEASHVKDRFALLEKFINHMGLHHDMVKMVPLNGGSHLIDESSALVSGNGDCTDQKTSGLLISWPVGCGQVKEGHFPILQRLDDDSSSGEMSKAVGYSIVGWRVSNSHLQAPKRKRRQADIHATATPRLTPVMPTKTDSATEEPMSRPMPSKSASAMIQPTPTQPIMEKSTAPVTEMIKPTTTSTTTTTTEETTTKKKMDTEPPAETTPSMVTEKPTDKATTPVVIPPDCVPSKVPTVKKAFTKLLFNVGDVINHMIPTETFEDCEVGGTRGLKLVLFRNTSTEIKQDFFLQFDEKMQKIIGLPMASDTGRYKMNLVARKGDNLELANVPFTIIIKGTKGKKKINHELSVAIDLDYNTFIKDARKKADLANKVASIYGDSDTVNLVITKMDPGSVLFGWANTSLSSSSCPASDIKEAVSKLVNDDGTLSQNAIDKMKPYVLLGAEAAPSGACVGDPAFPTIKSKPRNAMPDPDSTTKEPMTTENIAKGSTGGDGDDLMLTTIIPAIVIVVILILALLIACCLYRKRRKGKMNVEEQNTFVNKGAPVIFPNELEDKPKEANQPLLVECSGAPPPEYHSRNASESPERDPVSNNANSPLINNHNNANGPRDDNNVSEIQERPYEPPPPVATSTNNKQPRPSQQPMSQPPQILP